MTGMILKNPANRNGLNTTATLWTLSGIVLAACGGGGGSGAIGRIIPTGLKYAADEPTFMVAGGMMMFHAPQHANARSTPYTFTDRGIETDTRIEMMAQSSPFAAPSVVSAAFVSDADLEAAAFHVEASSNLEMGNWIRLITSTDTDWDGAFFLTSLGADNNKLAVKELYIKLVDGVTNTGLQVSSNPSSISSVNINPSQIHKVYFEADVFRNGNKQGDVKATVLVNRDDNEREQGYGDGDVYFAIRATGEGSIEQTFTIRRNSFNEQDFRNNDGEWADIDGDSTNSNTTLTSENKNLVGYLVGGGLGPNYLRWISQDGASTRSDGFFVIGDTFYADFYADVPEGWNVRLIWWLDDVLESLTGFTPSKTTPLPGFDSELDFNYQGILADPAMAVTPNKGAIPMQAGQAYESNTAPDIADNGFSDITDSSNHFAPTVAGRYYVQVIIYDGNAQNANDRAATAHFGFDNLHEIDVLPENTPFNIFETYYNDAV